LTIKAKAKHLELIRKHGEETYPRECCGFLIGKVEDQANVLLDLYRAENEWKGSDATDDRERTAGEQSQSNRYLITPAQYQKADAFARSLGAGIIGYYHSHPDHPARPSGYDLDHSCWPGESYMIVSIAGGKADTLNSFSKPDYAHFEPEDIVVVD